MRLALADPLSVKSVTIARTAGSGDISPSLSLSTVLGGCPDRRAAARCMNAVPVETDLLGTGAVESKLDGDAADGLRVKMFVAFRILLPFVPNEFPDSGVLARVSVTGDLVWSTDNDLAR